MKKILSFVLVLAMIASMMCVSVSAFDNPQTGNLVGDNDGAVGVDKFEEQSNTTNVTATINSSVINRYAVDLEYSISNITLSGESVWNVKTLEYDATTLKLQIGEGAADTPVDGDDYVIGTMSLTNYSDLGLTVEFDMSMTYTTDVPITGDVYRTDAASAEGTAVAGAYTGEKDQDEAVVATYEARINSEDWAHAAAQLDKLAKTNGNKTFTVATVTFSVKPATDGHVGATTTYSPNQPAQQG